MIVSETKLLHGRTASGKEEARARGREGARGRVAVVMMMMMMMGMQLYFIYNGFSSVPDVFVIE